MGVIPTRMMPMGVRKPTLPYEADGLAAMWDSEWNAGVGKHETGRNNLKNLVPDSIFGPLVGRHVDIATTASNYVELENDILFSAAQSCNYQSYTVSTVMQSFRTAPNNCFVTIGQADGANQFTYSALGLYYWDAFTTYYDVDKYYRVSDFSNKKLAYSLVVTPSAIYEYRNGTLANSIQYQKSTPPISNVRFGFGSPSYTDHKLFFSGAVYSRALTAEEIAHNYAIDKARFNLP